MNLFEHLAGIFGRVSSPTQGLYLHNTEKRGHTSMPRAGFESVIPVFERPKTVRTLGSTRSSLRWNRDAKMKRQFSYSATKHYTTPQKCRGDAVVHTMHSRPALDWTWVVSFHAPSGIHLREGMVVRTRGFNVVPSPGNELCYFYCIQVVILGNILPVGGETGEV
jgi:hypothetical protein